MRCIASSPVAAVQALKTRAKLEELTQDDERVLENRAFDGDDDDMGDDDAEPASIEDPKLKKLLDQAISLAQDPRTVSYTHLRAREDRSASFGGFGLLVPACRRNRSCQSFASTCN